MVIRVKDYRQVSCVFHVFRCSTLLGHFYDDAAAVVVFGVVDEVATEGGDVPLDER